MPSFNLLAIEQKKHSCKNPTKAAHLLLKFQHYTMCDAFMLSFVIWGGISKNGMPAPAL
jgi:hypothetical protein